MVFETFTQNIGPIVMRPYCKLSGCIRTCIYITVGAESYARVAKTMQLPIIISLVKEEVRKVPL
jgi:hypothetical protein